MKSMPPDPAPVDSEPSGSLPGHAAAPSDEGKRRRGEFDLWDLYAKGRTMDVRSRVAFADGVLGRLLENAHNLGPSQLVSASDREVAVLDPISGHPVSALMFGSNNYLGLANHPHVRERAREALDRYGIGTGGPPLFNGQTRLHAELEERLAAFKRAEATLLFATGYATNTGVLSGLMRDTDVAVFDEFIHTSFWDGIRTAGVRRHGRFRHNDVGHLEELLGKLGGREGSDLFVGVEGVYSMDGDLAPLDKIVPSCRARGAVLILDDAHGTGIMGENGRGAAEHFGVENDVDVTTATLGKAFGVLGGFACASRPIVQYLRFVARSHMFSTTLPPVVVAAVLASLDVLEREPWRRRRLLDNVLYATEGLRRFGLRGDPRSAIMILPVPAEMNPHRAAACFQKHRVFVNYAPYPAVPVGQQRFRISVMANHTRDDIDRLVACIDEVWSTCIDR